MSEDFADAAPTANREQHPPERLSIAQLMLFTATSAVYLGLRRALQQDQQEFRLFGEVVSFCYAPLFGAGLAACLIAAWRLVNGGPRFPRQPGHWFLVLGGVTGLVSLSFQILLVLTKADFSFSPLWGAVQFLSAVADIVLYVLAARDSRGFWRWVFGAGAIKSLFMLAVASLLLVGGGSLYLQYWIDYWLYELLSVGVILAAISDGWRGEWRDYLHWVGVATRLAYAALISAIPLLLDWLKA